MSEEGSFTSLDGRLRNRVEMSCGRRLAAECDVTLRACETCALVPLIDLVIQNPTVVECRRHVTTFAATTRLHGKLLGLVARRVHGRYAVTLCALQIGMRFVTKRAGRDAIAQSR